MENEEDRKKEQQEIERLRQKQIEEAKKKLIKENEVTQKVINGEKENIRTLKQVSKDDMLKDIVTTALLTTSSINLVGNVLFDKIINKSKK